MSAKKTTLENEMEKYQNLWNENYENTLKKINYSRKQLELDLEHLRQWLRDQQHLPDCRLKETDNFLTMYLSGCKGSMETAKRKLDAYYSLRGKTEIYRDRDPLDVDYRKMSDIWQQIAMPRPTDKGEFIVFTRLSDGIEEIPANPMVLSFKRTINITEIALRLHQVTHQLIAIMDFDRYPASLASTITLSLFRDMNLILEKMVPFRIAKIICINVSPMVEFAMNTIVRPLIKTKIRDRFIVTTKGYEELPKYVDKAILPKDMQGDYPLTFKEINDAWNEYEIENRDWFINELSEQVDETKRIDSGVKYIIEDNLFGVQGTLKKLVVD
ncbi:hypothetical protein O3M35_001808 [Rhynocoris fuscipes]|uniref:CRAL-TRIO domain-containing protein n=1 Tax=Rhynocoris fuscipes TaxID=488301 RepID=A0AAW1CPX3_9HEMI